MLPKPDEFFKKSLIEWEQQAAEAWNAMLRDPAFLKVVWQSVETGLTGQRALRQLIQENLVAWNLPTREKQAHIQQQIRRIQNVMVEVSGQIDRLLQEVKE